MPSTFSLPLPPGGLSAPAVATINHLLAQEGWARATLQRHAGKTACIDLGVARVCMRVMADGMLEASGVATSGVATSGVATSGVATPGHDALDAAAPAVTIHVKPSDVPLILQNRDRAFSYVRIEGDADFANTISQLANGLCWDAEHDLERVFGPIAAHRLAGGARSVAEGVATAGRRFAENVAEFLLEERHVLVRPSSVDGFAADVSRTRDDVERAAKRIAKLEQRLQQRLAQHAANVPAASSVSSTSSSTALVPAPANAVVALPTPPSDKTTDT